MLTTRPRLDLMLRTAGTEGSIGASRSSGGGCFAGRHMLAVVSGGTSTGGQLAAGAGLEIIDIWDANGGAESATGLEGLVRATHLVTQETARVRPGLVIPPLSMGIVQLREGEWQAAASGTASVLLVRDGTLKPMTGAMTNLTTADGRQRCETTSMVARSGDAVVVCGQDVSDELARPGELIEILGESKSLRWKALALAAGLGAQAHAGFAIGAAI